MALFSPTSVEDSAKPSFKIVGYNTAKAASQGFANVPSANILIKDPANRSLITAMINNADFDLTNDIYSFTVEKTMMPGTPAGSFNISVVDNPRPSDTTKSSWLNLLYPDDLIFICINDGGPEDQLNAVMLGLIDRVSEVTDVSGEQATSRLHIQGRDLGKWFLNSRFDAAAQTYGLYGLKQVEIAGNADSHIEGRFTILGAAMDTAPVNVWNVMTKVVMPQHVGIAKFVKLNVTPDTGFKEKVFAPFEYTSTDSNCWECLEQVSFRPFCEMWCDTAETGNFIFAFRRTPFDLATNGRNPGWDDLPTWEIDERFIVSRDLGFADHERVNFVLIEPQMGGSPQDWRFFRQFTRGDLASITAHGLMVKRFPSRYLNFDRQSRVLDIGTADNVYSDFINIPPGEVNFVEKTERSYYDSFSRFLARIETLTKPLTPPASQNGTDQQSTSKYVDNGTSWAGTMWKWNVANHLYLNGSITVKGMSKVRVGDRVKLKSPVVSPFRPRKDMNCYVLGVTHSFLYPNQFTSTFEMNRGQTDDFAQKIENSPDPGLQDSEIVRTSLVENGSVFPATNPVSLQFINAPAGRLQPDTVIALHVNDSSSTSPHENEIP